MVFWLHTARTENPDTSQTHPSASNFHEYHSNTTKHLTDIPQTPPKHLQGTQHANRREQTPPDTPGPWRRYLSMSGSVDWRLLSSVCMSCSLEISGVCLWDVWGYMRSIHGKGRRLDVFGGYLGSQSLQYGAKTPFWHNPKRHNFFSPDHTKTSKYQNRRI